MGLLNLAGASDEDIAADFALTQENTPATESAITRVQKFMEALGMTVSREEALHLLAAEPATALLTLDMIRRNYGSTESYLRNQLELTDAEVFALKAAIVKDTGVRDMLFVSASVVVVSLLAAAALR